MLRFLYDAFATVGGVALLLARGFYYLITFRVSPRLTLRQMSELGVNTIPIAVLVMAFVGSSLSYVLAGELAERNAEMIIPGSILLILLRELLPVLVAVVFAGKVGASIAAEIGSMKVTEQIDALRTLEVDPDWYLTIPRLFAAILMMPVIGVFGGYSGYYAGWLMANSQVGIPLSSWVSYSDMFVEPWDYAASVIKMLIFAAVISMVAVLQGYKTSGGAAGVGDAVTSSVTVSIVLIFALDLVLLPILF